MKEFLEPKLDVLLFSIEDIVTVSVNPEETVGGIQTPDKPF